MMMLNDPKRGIAPLTASIGQRESRTCCKAKPPPVRALGQMHLAHRQQERLRGCRALSTESVQRVLVDTLERKRYLSDPDDEGDDLEAGPSPRTGLGAPDVSFVSLVDGKYTVRGRLLLPASAANVYSLLTDYASCHRVFTNIAGSEVIRTAAGGLEVLQSCRWTFLAFSGTFRVHLGVQEDPGSGTLLFSLVHSNFMRGFEGRWTVRPLDQPPPPAAAAVAGGLGGEWCEVEHQLAVVPSVSVPAPLAYYTRSVFVRQVEGILADLQRGVAAVAAEQA